MANAANQKLRLLYLLEFFIKKTTPDVGLTTNQLLDELANVGIDTERKSLYRDFKSMREYGLEIEQNKSHEWYLANRPFSLDELMMLVDAVQSTPFLTSKMSSSLIKKLKSFASEMDEKRLNARIEISEYVKMTNEDVFWNIDAIQKAIASRRKVAFKYFRYVGDDGKLVKEIHHDHLVVPLKLIYADEKYYLLAFDESFDDMTPYRVDRMLDVVCSNEPIPRKKEIATWKLEDDAVLSFGIFGSRVKPVTLEIPKDELNVIVDKFGTSIELHKRGADKVRVHVKAPLSPQFYGWLFQLVGKVKLVAPKKAVEEYKGYCEKLLEMYSSE